MRKGREKEEKEGGTGSCSSCSSWSLSIRPFPLELASWLTGWLPLLPHLIQLYHQPVWPAASDCWKKPLPLLAVTIAVCPS